VVLAVVAFFTVSVGLAAAVFASLEYEHRAEISRARTPVAAADVSHGNLFWAAAGSDIDGRIVQLVALEPVGDRRPTLPPGVSALPDRGEAVLSPALHELLVKRGVPDRYGAVVDEVADDALTSPGELIAYVRSPRPLSVDNAMAIRGFGVSSDKPFDPFTGDVLYDRSVAEFWAMSLSLMVVPGLVALAASARVADQDTRRRHILLSRLGAGRLARMLIAAPRVALAVTLSLALTGGLLALLAWRDTTMPFTNHVVSAANVRDALPLLVPIAVGAHVAAAAILVLLSAGRLSQVGATRLVAPRDRPAWVRSGLLVALVAAQPWFMSAISDGTLRALATLVAVGVAVICVPATLSTLAGLVSRWRARGSLSRGRVGRFLGWRMMNYHSRAIGRLTSSVVALVIVVGHAAVVLALFVGPAAEARATEQRIGNSMVVAQAGAGAASVVQFAHDRGLAAVRVDGYMLTDELEIVGECPDLESFGLPCSAGELALATASPLARELFTWYNPLGGFADIVVAEATDENVLDPSRLDERSSSVVAMVDPDGAEIDRVMLARDAYLELDDPVTVEQLGAGSLVGALDLLGKSRWILTFGAPGVFTLLLVSGLVWAVVVVEESKVLARNPMLVDRQDVLDSVAAIRVALPIAVGGATGVLVTTWLLLPHARSGATTLPGGFLVGTACVTLIVAGLSWLAARRLMGRAAIGD
jgi:hypothetical protein